MNHKIQYKQSNPKTMKKMFLFLGLLAMLTSCSMTDYRVKVTHRNNEVDTLIIDTSRPQINYEQDLVSHCGCETYSYSVKSFNIIGKVEPPKEESNFNKQVVLFFLFVVMFLLVILFYIKTEQSIMKKIIKYIAYGVIVILSIKIGALLIQYLPPHIESFLK